jgi:L-seryl-tRNA(Ser) seleniumtransferase
VGGGALPGETLPSALLCLDVRSPNRFLSRLRALPTPVVARILDEKVVLDPRTVLPFQEGALLSGLRQVLGK